MHTTNNFAEQSRPHIKDNKLSKPHKKSVIGRIFTFRRRLFVILSCIYLVYFASYKCGTEYPGNLGYCEEFACRSVDKLHLGLNKIRIYRNIYYPSYKITEYKIKNNLQPRILDLYQSNISKSVRKFVFEKYHAAKLLLGEAMEPVYVWYESNLKDKIQIVDQTIEEKINDFKPVYEMISKEVKKHFSLVENLKHLLIWTNDFMFELLPKLNEIKIGVERGIERVSKFAKKKLGVSEKNKEFGGMKHLYKFQKYYKSDIKPKLQTSVYLVKGVYWSIEEKLIKKYEKLYHTKHNTDFMEKTYESLATFKNKAAEYINEILGSNNSEIKQLENTVLELQNSMDKLASESIELNKQLAEKEGEIVKLNNEINEYKRMVSELENDIIKNKAQEQDDRKDEL